MNKYFNILKGLAIVLVIVGAPLMSYLYLREGLAFRIKAIEYLMQSEEEVRLTQVVKDNFSLKKDYVNVLLRDKNVSSDVTERVYDKFKGHKQFHLIGFSESDTTKSITEIKKNHNTQIISNNLVNYDMVLVDTALQVRSVYMNNPEEMTLFIQHLSVLLPVEISKKIVLERQMDE